MLRKLQSFQAILTFVLESLCLIVLMSLLRLFSPGRAMTNSRATMRVFSTMSRTAGMKFTKLSPRTRNTPAFSSCPGGRVFGMQTLKNRNIAIVKIPKN